MEENINHNKQCGNNQLADGFSIDEVGGFHGEGVGYNPNGIFCGECSRLSCKSCVNKDSKDDGGEN